MMNKGGFLRPRLRGGRFEDGAIPLEVLGDFAALQDMVLGFARWRFLMDNPDRERLPRGFRSFDLRLTGMDKGSAVALIDLAPDQPDSYEWSGYTRYLEQAIEEIARVIDAAEHYESSASLNGLPKNLLAGFNRFGRSLRDDEAIELTASSRNYPVRLTNQSRNRLVRWGAEEETSPEVTLRGVISEADQARMTFGLRRENGTKVTCPIPKAFQETVIAAFSGYRTGQKVMVKGKGRLDPQRRLYGLESVDYISWLDPLDVPTRLNEFRGMRNGWLEGDGRAPDHAGLDWLSASFERHYSKDIPLPHTYPTPEGGVQLEWSLGSQEISLGIDFNTHVGYWHNMDMTSADDYERYLSLDRAEEWVWLVSEIRAYAENGQ